MKKQKYRIKLDVIFDKYEFDILKTMLDYVCCDTIIVGNDEYFKACDKLRKKLLDNSYYI